MQQVIWKWPVAPESQFVLELPRGAQILTVQEQHGRPQLWALVDPSAPVQRRTFRVMPTGIEWECDGELLHYLGTFQLKQLVFHLFEIERGN